MKWSLMPDISGNVIKTTEGRWEELLEHLRAATGFPNKMACPMVKLATFGKISKPSGALRHNDNVLEVFGVEGDYDDEKVALEQALKMLESHQIKAAVFPTPTNTHATPRWRVLAPLSKPYAPEERDALMARLNGALGGILASESFTLSQSYFYGGTPFNQYVVCPTFDDPEEGYFLDELSELDEIAIGKKTKQPIKTPVSDLKHIVTVPSETARDLRSALTALSANDYNQWIDLGHALKTISQGRSLWLEWSQTSEKYDPAEAARKWDGFNPTSTGYKAVFSRAKSAGWINTRSNLIDFSGLLNTGTEIDNETGELLESMLKPVSVSDVFTNPSDPPQFIWDGYLPRGVVSLFAAHGGSGKSTIALMLGVCAALGRPLFGVKVTQCRALFVSLEDSAKVVRNRIKYICTLWGIDPSQLDGKLIVVDGTEYPELFSAESRKDGMITQTYLELKRIVLSQEVELVMVDNASDAFGGDEIQRRQVRAFIRSLAVIARLTDCAFMLLSHVDKGVSRSNRADNEEAYSGSTAWHNSVRSRLYLNASKNDGLLNLSHQKSNLGRCREPLTLEWLEGGLPQLNGQADITGLMNSVLSSNQEARTKEILAMVAEFEDREQYCSHIATARNNVFAILSCEPKFKKLQINKLDCRHILNQCQRNKMLDVITYTDSYRKTRKRWSVTKTGRAFAGLIAPSAPSAPSD
jgi:hypothetical protein